MPYITQRSRDIIEEDNRIGKLFEVVDTIGDLNYIFTRLCQEYLKRSGEHYSTYNELVGVLECCKLELYRRKVSIYEDEKIEENGDVY